MSKVVTLGEILIRYSTPKGQRLGETKELLCHYGGSEPNVAIGMSGLGHSVTLLSALPDNPLGVGALTNLAKNGVDTSRVIMTGERVGAYFVEVGAGARATTVTYDRKHSSLTELSYNAFEDETIFKEADIFHVSGITTALSEELLELSICLMEKAKREGLLVSFDSNYRSKLWSLEDAAKAYERILPLVDYLSASKLDAINLMGISEKEVANHEEELSYYYGEMVKKYPNLTIIYSTIREVVSTDENYLTGTLWKDNTLFLSKKYHIPFIVDRIGGGDSFSAGMLHGLLSEKDYQHSIEFATGMSVLKHTYQGDSVNLKQEEIEHFIKSNSSKIIR
ncbi:sugar kinase [Vagococcus fluvialis]|jgi:2-dehydro-3-deoxygluconokinase|uniref:sugar kinase n=1 Tax=Vagococcus fluvialis TaxID=2738 RepID=UPI0020341FE9|nr:sugar kinase [Vagococcus fluvialis]MCM2139568.1 sugar kinase [Vagococcus fluvialis]MDR2276340.1 sugar kinase [Vagococcus sp.]